MLNFPAPAEAGDSASMNTVWENPRNPCSWILTFVRMTWESLRRHHPGRVLRRRPGRRDEPDVELAQLFRTDFARRVHHQILGALVHRKEHDLAKIGLAGEQHDDAVDARRRT